MRRTRAIIFKPTRGRRIVAAGGRPPARQAKQTFDLTVPEVDVYDIASGQMDNTGREDSHARAGCMAVARDGKWS